jgi:hypothetical protein
LSDDPFADDPFSGPQNDFIKITESPNVGELLWITPTRFLEQIDTSNGRADAVDADVMVLTEKGKALAEPRELKGVRIFGKWLVPSVKRNIGGKPVVGVVVKDEAKKQKGKNAPWVLRDPSADEKKIAYAYYEILKAQSPFEAPATAE